MGSRVTPLKDLINSSVDAIRTAKTKPSSSTVRDLFEIGMLCVAIAGASVTVGALRLMGYARRTGRKPA